MEKPEDYLYGPMRVYPERGGKRSRPALVLLACGALGGDPRRAMRTAAAFEMFQSFALLHDDIEDDSEMRRGEPCMHRLHGVPLSINIGDALYAKVFEMLAANDPLLGCEMTLTLIGEMLLGSRETFEGQAYDIGWIRSRKVPDEEEFMTMLRKKTGWYTGRGPCRAGAIIAGAPEAQQRAIGDFGEAMAIAFQIRDDLLNLVSAEDDAAQAPGLAAGGLRQGAGRRHRRGQAHPDHHRPAAQVRRRRPPARPRHPARRARRDDAGADRDGHRHGRRARLHRLRLRSGGPPRRGSP